MLPEEDKPMSGTVNTLKLEQDEGDEMETASRGGQRSIRGTFGVLASQTEGRAVAREALEEVGIWCCTCVGCMSAIWTAIRTEVNHSIPKAMYKG